MGLIGAGMARLDQAQETTKADITLQIAPVTVELAPDRVVSTIGYNGTSPGPVLRMREGVPVTVDIVNDTDVPEQVHWHGLLVPPEIDGAEEEGTPPAPPHERTEPWPKISSLRNFCASKTWSNPSAPTRW